MTLTFDLTSRTSGLSREQRGLGRPKLAQSWPTLHVTRTPLSRSKGQGHQAALRSAALTRKAVAAVSVETYSAWESTATLRLLGGARGVWAPTGEERGGGILCTHTTCLNCNYIIKVLKQAVRVATQCPRPSPAAVGAPASRAQPNRRNVAVVSHDQ